MAFCPNCGKEVKDGEVCSCQAANQSAKAKAAVNIDVNAMATGFVGTVKEIIADPSAGAKKFVDGVNWIVIALLAVVYALINVVTNVIDKIARNIEMMKNFKENEDHYEDMADMLDMDLEDYIDKYDLEPNTYGIFDFIKGAISDVLYVAAGIAITALVIFFAVKLINKINMTWKQAFAIATIDLLIYLPIRVVTEVLGILPDFRLLSWIISALWALTWGGTILEFLGLKSVCGDTKKAVYAGVPAMAVISLVSSVVNMIIAMIF